ncbi:hypothetical protein [Sphingomonas sp. 35-24ZXX]|uniref:hypothetical protein n=1 Tax=Sphingomonas sp. 35-24ZXX TaxID=1545915 RepID=UPI00053BDB8F|nr:hypothetical protein [Sphingomonas sp. 35-24ZXX]
MLEPFVSSKLLLDRAREHLDQFNHLERIFVSENPYTRFREIDPNTGEHLLKVKAGQPSVKLSAIAFDIVNCVRSALDHIVYDSARMVGGNPKPKDTKFPFGKTADAAAANLGRYKDSEVPDAIRPYLLAFEPYKGGQEALWEINELRNCKIHRILQSFAMASGGVGFGNGYITQATVSTCNEWDDDRGELTVMRIAPGAEYNIQMRISVRVILGDTSLLGHKPAAEIFGKFIEVGERILLGVKAESERLAANG